MLSKLSTRTQSAIKLVEVDEDRVVFVSECAFTPGDALRMSADGEAVVTVEGHRMTASGHHLHWGSLSSGGLESTSTLTDGDDRNCARTSVCLKARSPELPNYAAMTENLSPWGVCLRTVEPLTPGKSLTLTLEDTEATVADIPAIVRWSSLTEPFWCGLSFESGPWQARLNQLLEERQRQAPLLDQDAPVSEPWHFPVPGQLITVDSTPSALTLTIESRGHHYVFSFEEPDILELDIEDQTLASVTYHSEPAGKTRVTFYNDSDLPVLELESPAFRAFCSLATG